MAKYKIALIESTTRVIEILTHNLQTEYHFSVSQFYQAEECIPYLEGRGDYNLIIVRNIIDEKEAAKKILSHLYDLNLNIPVIVLGDIELKGIDFISLPDRFPLKELISEVRKALGLSIKELEEMKGNYVPIPIHFFHLMNTSTCDIYIKLKKEGQDQYVKRIKKGETFEKESILKYEGQGVDEFFVEYEKKTEFLNCLMSNALDHVGNVDKNAEKNFEVTADSYDLIQELTHELGINPAVQELAVQTVRNIIKTVAKGSSFASFLKSVLTSKNGFAYKHSLLTSIILHEVVSKLDLGPTNANFEKVYEKMVFVSFFHDMFLEDDELMKVHSAEEMNKYSMSEKDLINTHANKAATKILEFNKAPLGADIIIRQHHGTTNGIGFNNNGSGISPLAQAFMVVESFVHHLLVFEDKRPPIRDIFNELYGTYTQSSYKKIVDVLRDVLSKSAG